jgi:carbamate kinase
MGSPPGEADARVVSQARADRIVVALGGNAIAPRHRGGTAAEQTANLAIASKAIVELIAAGHEPVITHGNGPQVGNLVLKNEMAADVVPAMPLDWCVAQTQATIGFTLVTQIEAELAKRSIRRNVVSVITRVLVDKDDPSFTEPTKPIGRWRPDGTRRVVPSPAPLELLDLKVIEGLLDADAVVIACGGGGIPMIRRDGALVGVEAVIDKDRCAALLASRIGAQRLVIATDIAGIEVDHGTPMATLLRSTTPSELADRLAAGEYPEGSMGPKVEAVAGFVASTGGTAAVGALGDLSALVAGQAGTQVC